MYYMQAWYQHEKLLEMKQLSKNLTATQKGMWKIRANKVVLETLYTVVFSVGNPVQYL